MSSFLLTVAVVIVVGVVAIIVVVVSAVVAVVIVVVAAVETVLSTYTHTQAPIRTHIIIDYTQQY